MNFENVKIEFEMKSDFFIEHIWKCQSESTLILFWIGLILNKNGAYIEITHDDS